MRRYHNGLKTALLLGLLTALILTAGYWLGGGPGLIGATVLSLAMNAADYFWSDKLPLRAMATHPVTERQPPQLHAMVRELVTSAVQPVPRLSPAPSPSRTRSPPAATHATPPSASPRQPAAAQPA